MCWHRYSSCERTPKSDNSSTFTLTFAIVATFVGTSDEHSLEGRPEVMLFVAASGQSLAFVYPFVGLCTEKTAPLPGLYSYIELRSLFTGLAYPIYGLCHNHSIQ